MKNPIKLFELEKLSNGTIRLASQLCLDKGIADFILDQGVLKHWQKGDKGFGFYETKTPYTIVDNISEMQTQLLG